MPSRARSCTGKVRHRDQDAVIKALRVVNNAQMNDYPCEFCGGWHIGHSNRQPKIQARLDQLLGPDPFIKSTPPQPRTKR